MTVEELIATRETVGTMTDDQLRDFAQVERAECGSNSDYVTEEFESRMKKHGCPADRVAATQINYIAPSETLRQFARRIAQDKEF